MRSKRVSKKASMLDPILKLFLSILEAPGGAERQNGFQNRFKNGLGFKARSFHPRKPSRSSFCPPRASILEPPGADFRGLGRFIGSLAGSTFAAKRLANKWWSAVLAEP